MNKSSRLLSIISSLSLLATGQILLAQTETAGYAATGLRVCQAATKTESLPAPTKEDPARTSLPAMEDSARAPAPVKEAAQEPAPAQAEDSATSPPGKNAKKPVAKSAAEKSAKHKSTYVKEEPVSDPGESPTRVHRPGHDSSLPPLAPTHNGSSAAVESPMPLYDPPPASPPQEKFPSVGQLEQLMFGHSTPTLAVDNRLDKLEIAIFQKRYSELDTEQRIKRLKEVIVGEDYTRSTPPSAPPATTFPSSRTLGMTLSDLEREPAPAQFFPNYGHYDLNQQLSIPEVEKFALVVINELRQQQGLTDLTWDEKVYELAKAQVSDLLKRDIVSHLNAVGENPDLRYTKAGGSDAVMESVIMFPSAEKLRPTRQLVIKMLETLHSRQDDREDLLSPHASTFSLAFQWSSDRQKLLCCTEVVTKHGEMEAVPLEAAVGDKVEIKGSITPPYKFQKITLAWEGLPAAPQDDSAELSDALPYFPPLDYEVYAVKSNRDFDKGIKLLQIAGITAAIAGGVFIPPIALAAPLIAASIVPSTPKAVSEIAVKGGVKTDGINFTRMLTLSNQSKEGIYYVTIWASSGASGGPVAISRRTIIARKEHANSDNSKSNVESKGENKKDGKGNKEQPASP